MIRTAIHVSGCRGTAHAGIILYLWGKLYLILYTHHVNISLTDKVHIRQTV